MANRNFAPLRGSLDRDVVKLFGVVTFGGSGAVSSTDCLGFDVTKPSGTGLYRIALEDKYPACLGVSGQVFNGGAAPADVDVQIDAEMSGTTIDIRLTRPALNQTLTYPKTTADGAAGDATAETYIGAVLNATTLTSAVYVPAASLTAHDTNYATLTVYKRTSAGASQTAIASQTTKITGGSGNWTAGAPVALTLAGGGATTIAAGSSISFDIAKAVAGVIVPAGSFVLVFQPTTAQVPGVNATSGWKLYLELTFRNTSVRGKGV